MKWSKAISTMEQKEYAFTWTHMHGSTEEGKSLPPMHPRCMVSGNFAFLLVFQVGLVENAHTSNSNT